MTQKNIQEAATWMLKLCADYCGVTPEDIISKRKSDTFVIPRHVFVYLCCEYLPLTKAQIGEILGGRDHSSILHSRNMAADAINRPRSARDVAIRSVAMAVIDQIPERLKQYAIGLKQKPLDVPERRASLRSRVGVLEIKLKDQERIVNKLLGAQEKNLPKT